MDGDKSCGHVHYAFAILASCIVITSVAFGFVYGCSGIFYAPVSAYFGVPTASFALYFSIFNLAITVSLPTMGRLMVSMDQRLLLSVCGVFLGGGLFCMSLCQAVWQFYVCGAVMGVGMAPFVYLMVPTLVNAWFRERVGFFIGLSMSFTGIIGIVFNPIGASLIQASPEGWRTAYRLFGTLTLAGILPLTALVIRNRPEDKGLEPYGRPTADGSGEKTSGVTAGHALRSASFVALLLFMASVTTIQTINSYIPSYASSMADVWPDVAANSGTLASIVMLGNSIGLLCLGFVNDRSVMAGVVSAGVCGVAGFALLWACAGNLALMYVGAFLFGVCYAATALEAPLLNRECFGSRDYTVITSRISTVGAGVAIVLGVVWGVVIDTPAGFVPVFVAGIATSLLSVFLAKYALGRKADLAGFWES